MRLVYLMVIALLGSCLRTRGNPINSWGSNFGFNTNSQSFNGGQNSAQNVGSFGFGLNSAGLNNVQGFGHMNNQAMNGWGKEGQEKLEQMYEDSEKFWEEYNDQMEKAKEAKSARINYILVFFLFLIPILYDTVTAEATTATVQTIN